MNGTALEAGHGSATAADETTMNEAIFGRRIFLSPLSETGGFSKKMRKRVKRSC